HAAAATTSSAGMMKRRHSGRRRGAGGMSGMRRPLASDFGKCKHPLPTTKGIEITSLYRAVLVAVRGHVRNYPQRYGILDRRPLGVRLRLPDVAPGLRIHRTGAGTADRRTPRALRLFLRPSRHAGKARPGAR